MYRLTNVVFDIQTTDGIRIPNCLFGQIARDSYILFNLCIDTWPGLNRVYDDQFITNITNETLSKPSIKKHIKNLTGCVATNIRPLGKFIK